jgi:hypothetical protein
MHEWVPRFTKLRLLAVILSAVAAIVVGASRITVVKEVYPVRTKIVRVPVPRDRALPGEMTDEQCLALRKGVGHRAILNQYGTPRVSDPDLDADDELSTDYPIKGTHGDRTCTLEWDFDGKLDEVLYSPPLH